MSKKIGKYIILLLWILVAAGTASAQNDVQIRATASVSQAQVGDQFNLQIQVQGSQDAARPAIPAVDGLEIYYGGASSSFQLINGRMSSSKTFNYTVLAKKAGLHSIDGVTVQAGNQTYSIDPVQVNVVDAPGQSSQSQEPPAGDKVQENESEALFLRAVPETTTVYENQQIVLQYILYRDPRVRLSNRINFENMESTLFQGFLQEEVPRQPGSIGTRNIDGRQYEAIVLKTIVLFPLKPGTITIDPVRLVCQVAVPQSQSRRQGFDSFFDDFFGSSWNNVRVLSNPVTVNVLPLPEQGRPENFSGAVGQFQLIAHVDKNEVQEDNPLTLNVQLRGRGNLRMMDDPKLPSLEGFEQFEGTRQEDISPGDQGLSGDINYEYVLIPRDPNIDSIGPLEFSYFDPEQRTYKQMRTNPIPLVVHPGEEDRDQSTVFRAGDRQDLALASEDFRHIVTDLEGPLVQGTRRLYRSGGFLAAILVPWFIVLGTVVVQKRQEKLASDPVGTRRKRAYSTAIRELSRLENEKTDDEEKIAHMEEIVHRYLSQKFNFQSRGLTHDQLETQLREKGTGESEAAEVCGFLRELEDIRYAPGLSAQSSELISKTKDLLGRLEKVL